MRFENEDVILEIFNICEEVLWNICVKVKKWGEYIVVIVEGIVLKGFLWGVSKKL